MVVPEKRLAVKIAEGASRFVCQTRDSSRSGILAVTENRYPLGAGVRGVLDLPDGAGEVAGDAEVVRPAAPPRDPVTGLGLRFVCLRPRYEQRFVGFLTRHGARRSGEVAFRRRSDDDAIAPAPLGLVKRHVGTAHQRPVIGAVDRVDRHAGGYRRLQGVPGLEG